MNKQWVKGFALYKKMWGGVYWTGTVGDGIGIGPMWTRAPSRAKVFPTLRAAYDAGDGVKELQECVPVRVVDEG